MLVICVFIASDLLGHQILLKVLYILLGLIFSLDCFVFLLKNCVGIGFMGIKFVQFYPESWYKNLYIF